MTVLKKYKNKKIAIYGMGITGISAAKILNRLKAKVYCWDDKKNIRSNIKKNFNISKFWEKKFILDYIVISPGIDINKSKIRNFLKKNSKKIITDLDLFFDLNKNAKVISITGTNGKSTTCKIIEKILKKANYKVKTLGNIGNPVLSFHKSKKKYVFILEISSYQLEYSKLFRSKHAAILNISPDHLDRHKNINNYIKIKSKLFFAQKKTDYSYINLDNKYSKFIKKIFRKNKIKSKLISINEKNFIFLTKKVKNKYFNNKGNMQNLFFAYKIAKDFDIKDKVIIQAINNFKGLAHRQEIIFSAEKLICINDSKATSFDASLQSLTGHNKIYWIVGGIPKKQDRFYLKKLKKNIIKAYIIGNRVSFFKNQLKKNIPYKVSKNIKRAVNDILKDLKSNKYFKSTILLSPAAASFDQFQNFEDRGNYFKNLIIKKIKKNNV